MLTLKDLLPIAISLLALVLSGYNFYVQQFRKRDKLIGQLVYQSVTDGEFSTQSEYSVANIGDTQLLIKSIWVMCSSGPVHYLLKSHTANVPSVLRPGDIAILPVQYNREDIEEECAEGERCFFQLEVLSTNGICYRIRHQVKGPGVTRESIWNVFALTKEHASQGEPSGL
ncbi:MAG: hypothetical protein OEL88_08675 [Sterolibacteriaceae bacterium MAG5]|nr:hypothetical protein [Candidatus Nitricoxidireducens bremensis]